MLVQIMRDEDDPRLASCYPPSTVVGSFGCSEGSEVRVRSQGSDGYLICSLTRRDMPWT